MSALYAGFGRLLPEDLSAFRADVDAMRGFDGLVFSDPEDGLEPAFLAGEARRAHPELAVVLPLVARDRNRTALLGAARTAAAAGAAGLLLLSGRLDPAQPARTVYELDPAQMAGFLRENGVDLRLWVSSRCSTEAERARVRSLLRHGASRCLVPWTSEDPLEAEAAFGPVYAVGEADWAAGRVPAGDVVLRVTPGRGAEAAQWADRFGRAGRAGRP